MRRRVLATLGIVTLVVSFLAQPSSPAAAQDGAAKRAAKGQLPPPVISTGTVTRTGPTLSSGVVNAAADELRAEEADLAGGSDAPLGMAGGGTSPGSLGCSQRAGQPGQNPSTTPPVGNKRVNQDCSYRRQAEEQIIYNPVDPTNLIAGQNDSRAGFNQCGVDFSTDSGKHWGDLIPPFRQKVNFPEGQEPVPGDPNRHTILGGPGTLHTYDAGSDPTVAFDSHGRAYFSCLAFDVFSDASLLYVTASPPPAEGSFYFNIATTGRRFVVAEDNNPAVFHDKQFITADTYATLPNGQPNPNRDNVYVTWTTFRFSPDCGPQPNPGAEERYCSSPIFGSMSTDGARHWSTPELVSGASDALCFFGNFFTGNPTDEHLCNFDQGSEPRVLPNGDLEVIWNNGNTKGDNPFGQQLGVHCHPTGNSATGTAHLNCAIPTKVGDDVGVGEPQCDFGRGPEECIPGAYIRTNDFPRLSVNTQNGHLYATWQDYRNGEFDIQLAQSVDGGLTWSPSVTVNPDRGLDHYFPDVDISETAQNDDRVGDSYYRTERVPNENTTPPGGFAPGVNAGVGTGNSDYVLAGGMSLQAPYIFKVVSGVFPPPDGIQAGFNGDYSGLTITPDAVAHPIWSDTRNINPYPENGVAHDEDVYTDNVGLPAGQARPSVGQIGQS